MSPRPSTSLIHFYRGELGRLAIYRVRLDTTTNWAIGVVVAVLTFTLGKTDAPHALLLLPYLLTTVFLFIESRRYQELDMLRQRIRLMETGYFAPLFRQQEAFPDDVAARLADSLDQPEPLLPLWRAVAHRVQRNYLWLYLANHAGWGMKLYLDHINSMADLGVGRVSGTMVAGIAVTTLVPWVALALVPRDGLSSSV